MWPFKRRSVMEHPAEHPPAIRHRPVPRHRRERPYTGPVNEVGSPWEGPTFDAHTFLPVPTPPEPLDPEDHPLLTPGAGLIRNAVGTVAAAQDAVTIPVAGMATVGIGAVGTASLTYTFETSVDGITWLPCQAFRNSDKTTGTTAAAVTAGLLWIAPVAGAGLFRVRCSAFVSGAQVVTLIATESPHFAISAGGGGGGGGAVTVADGADTAEGFTTDAGIITDAPGTVIAFLRGAIIQWAKLLTQTGIVTEGAPASDTASSGLNGRLQRIAQRITTLYTTNLLTQGDVAHDGVDSGNPQKFGFRAVDHGANPTAVSAADRTDWLGNRAGVPFVIGGHPNIQTFAQNYTAAQTDTAVITVGAGTKIVVTGFMVTAHNANTVNVAVRLGFGTANTPAYNAAQLVGTHPGIAPGSGFGRGGGAGIIGIGADNEDLRLTSGVPTGGSIDCMVSYYTVPA